MSWDDIGLEVKDDRHQLKWRYCADLGHAWTGLVSLQPGQAELAELLGQSFLITLYYKAEYPSSV